MKKNSTVSKVMWSIVSDIAAGLKFIHEHSEESYGHLKPDNGIVSRSPQLLIKVMYSFQTEGWKLVIGTESMPLKRQDISGYHAPEILVPGQHDDKKSDIWALGCILGEMATGKTTFLDHSEVSNFYTNSNESPVTSFQFRRMEEVSKHCVSEVCGAMLDVAPWRRPPIKDILRGIKASQVIHGIPEMTWRPIWYKTPTF
jgi:serine/threonine protein kinase